MKKLSLILIISLIFLLSSCNKSSINQTELYDKINALVDDYSSDYISYSTVLKSTETNITLTNTGILTNDNGTYTYTYSYQYLNKIGSGSDSLVSTEEGEIVGTKEEILSDGLSISSDVKVVGLNLKDSFKTHTVSMCDDGYSMKGYIARNTILEYTGHIDDDIRFNYEIVVNKEVSEIKSFSISYVTERFDSIVIEVLFGEVKNEA